MAKQVIGIGSAPNDGTGDTLRDAFGKANDNFTELYNAAPVALEAFAGANDTAKLVNALASGERIVANAAAYNIDPTQLPAVTVPAFIEFGRNTVINSLQTSGTKLPILRFAGTGLTGSAVAVTAIETSYLKDTVTVADASGFAVGDTVLLSENEALQATTQFDGSSSLQDFNYREYLTIESISSNDITFEEFIRFPHDTAKTLRLQKVAFLDNVHVSGGRFAGPNAAGGGVSFSYCRNSTVSNCRLVGTSELNKNGGAALDMYNNWLCQFTGVTAVHSLYLYRGLNNQSCQLDRANCKRTSSGGIIIGGDRFCQYSNVMQDASGDDNGDSFQISNGARNNVISNAVIHGASCYTMWMFQSCDNNVITNLKSVSGVTACLNIYGDENKFHQIDVKGHGGNGIGDGGKNNSYTEVDIDVSSNGVVLRGSGTLVEGKVRTDASGSLRDVQLSNASDVVVRTRGGTSRGVNLSGTNVRYDVIHEGDVPYYSGRGGVRSRGWTWANTITGVTNTPANVKLIDEQGNIVDWVSRNASDTAECYRVTLKLNTTLANIMSEYIVTNRQNVLAVDQLYIGSGTYAAFQPVLSHSGGNIQIALASNAGPATVLMLVEKF